MNHEGRIRSLVEELKIWVEEQRSHHRPTARTLTPQEKGRLGFFFGASTLDVARVKRVAIIENPSCYSSYGDLPITLIDFSQMGGITFVDTILISQRHHSEDPPSLDLLFHELVHVVQYGLLGTGRFVERYASGWLESKGVYEKNPLERQAYDLEARFKNQTHIAFSVESEVKLHMAPG